MRIYSFFNWSNSKCQPVREILFVQKWRSKTGGHPCAHHIDEVMKPCYCSAVLTSQPLWEIRATSVSGSLQAPYNTSTSSQLQMSLSSTNHYHHAQFLISFIKSVCLLPRQFLAQNVFFSVEWCWNMVFQVRINKNCWRMSKKIGVPFQCFKCSKILIMFRKCL